MARKKVSKKAKAKRTAATTVKRSTKKSPSITLTQTWEKTFKEIPAKLIAHCRKEVAGLKQQEKKIVSDLKKAHLQQKTTQKKSAVIAAKHTTKPSAASKKQLAKQKQVLDKVNKIIAELNAKHHALKTESKTWADQQSKHGAIQKLLSSFEKEWAVKARNATVAKANPRKKTTKKPSATTTPAPTTTTTTYQEPNTVTDTDLEPIE